VASMTARAKAGIAVLVAIVVLVVLGILVKNWLNSHQLPFQAAPGCSAVGDSYDLTPEQAGNAETIAAVGLARGLPDRAVTIALATALQESKLRNLDHGDADSVGLFQQRPSQGWGKAADLQRPTYAAARFYEVLVTVRGWRTRPLTVVAQAVQRSAYPDAYAQWESTATALSAAMTGTKAAGLSCNYPDPGHGQAGEAATTLTADLAVQPKVGVTTMDIAVATTQGGWRVATWAVAKGRQFGITEVHYAGKVWKNSDEHWSQDKKPPGTGVRIVLAKPPTAAAR
jgi:hypothetical protein